MLEHNYKSTHSTKYAKKEFCTVRKFDVLFNTYFSHIFFDDKKNLDVYNKCFPVVNFFLSFVIDNRIEKTFL